MYSSQIIYLALYESCFPKCKDLLNLLICTNQQKCRWPKRSCFKLQMIQSVFVYVWVCLQAIFSLLYLTWTLKTHFCYMNKVWVIWNMSQMQTYENSFFKKVSHTILTFRTGIFTPLIFQIVSSIIPLIQRLSSCKYFPYFSNPFSL